MRLVAQLILCFTLLSARAASPALTLEGNELLRSPAPVSAGKPQFLYDSAGRIWLQWSEKARDAVGAAAFDVGTRVWMPPCTNQTPTGLPAHAIGKSGEIVVQRDGRKAKAWYEGAACTARVLLSVSPDAGEHFLLPVQIDDSHPCGAPDLVLLSDGTVFAVWPERGLNREETLLWLRRVSPGGSLSVPVLLGSSTAASPIVQIALVNGFENGTARLLVAYVDGDGDNSHLVIRLVGIEPATQTARHNPCNCPDDDEAATGYALRGTITKLSPDHGVVSILHGEIPEVLPEGVNEFKVEASFFPQAKEGSEVYGRVEKRGDDWWLFSPRLLVRSQK